MLNGLVDGLVCDGNCTEDLPGENGILKQLTKPELESMNDRENQLHLEVMGGGNLSPELNSTKTDGAKSTLGRASRWTSSNQSFTYMRYVLKFGGKVPYRRRPSIFP